MPHIVRPQFGPTPVITVYTPAPYTGFEPIVVDLAKRRLQHRIMANIRLWAMAGVCLITALGAAGFFIFSFPASVKKPVTDAYLVRAEPEALPEKTVGQIPEPHLPPIPKEALSPEVAGLIPVLKKLPIAEDFVPNAKMGSSVSGGITPAQAPHISISVIRDEGLARHDQFIADAAQAVQDGKNETAIKLYTAALKAVPDDRDAAYNLASLLLQKAAFLDSHGDTTEAIALYERALNVWGEKDGLAVAIHQRLDWIRQKTPQAPPLVAPAAYTETTPNE